MSLQRELAIVDVTPPRPRAQRGVQMEQPAARNEPATPAGAGSVFVDTAAVDAGVSAWCGVHRVALLWCVRVVAAVSLGVIVGTWVMATAVVTARWG